MLQLKRLAIIGLVSFLLTSCASNDGEDKGHSTPIDSTTMHGTAPATYGGDNPANYQDTVLENANDTGTKISTGPDSPGQGR